MNELSENQNGHGRLQEAQTGSHFILGRLRTAYFPPFRNFCICWLVLIKGLADVGWEPGYRVFINEFDMKTTLQLRTLERHPSSVLETYM